MCLFEELNERNWGIFEIMLREKFQQGWPIVYQEIYIIQSQGQIRVWIGNLLKRQD